MSKAMKDERLKLIQNEAAAIAYLVLFFVILGLMITRRFTEAGVLSDPDFLLVVPWLFSLFVMVGVGIKRGLFSTVREENTRKPKYLRSTRIRLTLQVLLFATIMFMFKRFDVFSDKTASVRSDMIDTLVVTMVWGALMWFFLVRKSSRKEK